MRFNPNRTKNKDFFRCRCDPVWGSLRLFSASVQRNFQCIYRNRVEKTRVVAGKIPPAVGNSSVPDCCSASGAKSRKIPCFGAFFDSPGSRLATRSTGRNQQGFGCKYRQLRLPSWLSVPRGIISRSRRHRVGPDVRLARYPMNRVKIGKT